MVPFIINIVQIVTQQPSLQTDSDLFMLWWHPSASRRVGFCPSPRDLMRINVNQSFGLRAFPGGLPEEIKREVFLEVSLLKTRHFKVLAGKFF